MPPSCDSALLIEDYPQFAMAGPSPFLHNLPRKFGMAHVSGGRRIRLPPVSPTVIGVSTRSTVSRNRVELKFAVPGRSQIS